MPNPIPLLCDIARLPSLTSTHVWADYIELRALTSEDKVFSSGALADGLNMADDIATDADSISEEEDSGGLPPQELPEPNVDVQQKKLQSKWRDIKLALTSRSSRMGASWPYNLDGDVLRLNFDPQNNHHQLYVALLLASSLRYIERKRHQEIADQLEKIGAAVFTVLMPSEWKVRVFGANGGEYVGTKEEKLLALARDIKAKPMFDSEDLNEGDRGDGGLDVVAWHAFNDELGQIPVAFAQCGCSPTDIDHKQLQASPSSINRWFKPDHPAANYFIAPLDFRNNRGKWERKPAEVILIDRARILELARRHNMEFVPPQFVQEAIEYTTSSGA